MNRDKIPLGIEVEVLTRSRRRCCLCLALASDAAQKKGQIAHINQRRDDHRFENLAFLCFDHHDEYDGRTSQSKGFTQGELRQYRDDLYVYVENTLALTALTPGRKGQRYIPLSKILSASGDFTEASRQFQHHRSAATLALREYREKLGEVAQEMRGWSSKTPALLQNPSKASISRHFNEIGTYLSETALALDTKTIGISETTARMFGALETAHVLASDLEFITPELFSKKRQDLAGHRETLDNLLESAEGAGNAIQGWRRSTSNFNRGRRLFLASIRGFCEELRRQLVAIEDQEYVLDELTELLL